MRKPVCNLKPHIILWGFFLSLFAAKAFAFGINSGGSTSVSKSDNNAFSLPSANMSFERRLDFSVGNSFFRNPWVIAPSVTTARDGLGPLFNTNGCQNCHIRDGRGHLPESDTDNAVSLLVRVSVAADSESLHQQVIKEGVIPHPDYGDQIQDFAVPGVPAEAQIHLHYEYKNVLLSNDERVQLKKPILKLMDAQYGPIDQTLQTSLRLAPPMIGLGLLEALSDDQIMGLADPDDKDGDGISGRWNRVWSVEQQRHVIGRFGWKAEQPSLKQQNAAAFNGDIGITSSIFPNENCTLSQSACQQSPSGGQPELSDKLLGLVTFYTRNLAVPKRRNLEDPVVKKGEEVFGAAGCGSCHTVTRSTPTLPDHPEQSDQIFHPYTDLLLHDMGDDLADGRPVYSASGREWRTPPLWGIGLTEEVSGFQHYLHDGRAGSLLEAILWHGGEAKASQQFVVNTSASNRQALLAFLKSL